MHRNQYLMNNGLKGGCGGKIDVEDDYEPFEHGESGWIDVGWERVF